jgi:hypothetical protein
MQMLPRSAMLQSEAAERMLGEIDHIVVTLP